MNKLFGPFLLALAFLAPVPANAVACFWVGGTGTWDNSAITHWAPTTGGAATGCQTSNAAPTTGDVVTFDGSSGGGTVTASATISGLSLDSLVAGAFTGTIDFSANNPNLTFTGSGGVNLSGAGTKTVSMGSGTFTLSSNAAFWFCGTCANLTLNAGTSTVAFTGTGGTSARRFNPGSKTYATVSVASGSAAFEIQGSFTVATFTPAPGNTINIGPNATVTATTITNVAGSSSAQILFVNQDPISGAATLTITNNWTCDWCGFGSTTFSGAGSKTATNSFDFKGNSGITITAPSVGGGGGGRIIGG